MTTITIVSNPNINVPIKVVPNVGPKGKDGEGLTTNNEQVIYGIENVTTFDSFAATDFRMVKYLISISKTDGGVNKFYGTELSILIDGQNTNVSEYGTIDNDGDIGTVTVSKSGDSVALQVIPNPAVTPITVRFARMGLKA